VRHHRSDAYSAEQVYWISDRSMLEHLK